VRVGIGLNKLGHREAAIAKVEDGMKQYREQLQTHANHGEDVFYAFELLGPVSDFYLDTNQLNKAIEVWEEYIRMAEPFANNNPDDTTTLGYISYAFELKGDVLSRYQRDRETFAETNAANLRAALKNL